MTPTWRGSCRLRHCCWLRHLTRNSLLLSGTNWHCPSPWQRNMGSEQRKPRSVFLKQEHITKQHMQDRTVPANLAVVISTPKDFFRCWCFSWSITTMYFTQENVLSLYSLQCSPLPCPTPLWQRPEWIHRSAVTNQWWAVNPTWAETRTRRGHRAVLTQVTAAAVIKEFETKFQDHKKIIIFRCMCDSIFRQHKYTTCTFPNGMDRAAIRQSTQKSDHVSLSDFHKPCLSKEKQPSLHSPALFTSLLFGTLYICEQPFPRMKHRKNEI